METIRSNNVLFIEQVLSVNDTVCISQKGMRKSRRKSVKGYLKALRSPARRRNFSKQSAWRQDNLDYSYRNYAGIK